MPSPSQPPPPSRGRIAATAVVVTVVAVMPLFLTGGLAVQMRSELGFGQTALGGAVAAFLGMGALVSTPFGRLADRIGPTRAMRAAAVLAALSAAGVALAARSWGGLMLWLAVGGMGNALSESAVNLFLTRTVRRARQGLAFGVKQAAPPGAGLLAGLAVPTVALTVGWRWAFAIAALASALAVALVPAVRARRPEEADRHGPPPMRLSALLVLAVGLGFAVGAASSLGAFLVDGAVLAGLSPGAAGLLLAFGSLTALLARLAVGGLADRREGGHLRVVVWMLLLGACGFGLLALQSAPALVAGTALAFGMGWGFVGLFFFAVVRLNPAAPGAASGVALTGGMTGGTVGPVVVGLLVERLSYPWAWSVVALWALIGATGVALGRAMILRDRRRAARRLS